MKEQYEAPGGLTVRIDRDTEPDTAVLQLSRFGTDAPSVMIRLSEVGALIEALAQAASLAAEKATSGEQ